MEQHQPNCENTHNFFPSLRNAFAKRLEFQMASNLQQVSCASIGVRWGTSRILLVRSSQQFFTMFEAGRRLRI